MSKRTGSKTDKILYLFGKRTKTVKCSSSEDGSSDEGNERFPVTRGLQTRKIPQHNAHGPPQYANPTDQNRRDQYHIPLSHNGPSEYISRIPPFGSVNFGPLDQLPHVFHGARKNSQTHRRLMGNTSHLPPLSLGSGQNQHQPPPYTTVAYQSTPRQTNPYPPGPSYVNPETYHFDPRATSRRDQDLRKDEDEDVGRPRPQPQAQQETGMIGRTNQGTRVHQKTSAAEIGNMNRTFIQGFDTPPAGSKNIAHFADDDD